tara:strand:- start:4687 stop:5103 length:417 start_codon:yes stop_codon:yes gene_type:complete
MSAERTYQKGKKTREAKKKIMSASEAGKYKGSGLGQAKGREMVKKVKEANKKDMEKYGGMDMPTKAKGGSVKKMAKGGKLPMVKKDGKMVPAFAADGKGKMAYGGKVKKMAYGGKVKKTGARRADGCATRGKTKGRMV